MAMLEKRILMNWENSKNLKSREFYRFIDLAISKALPLYFSITMWNTFTFTRTKWYTNKMIISHG